MTHTLHQALVDGRSFSQALSELPRIFPALYVNLVGYEGRAERRPRFCSGNKSLMQAKELREQYVTERSTSSTRCLAIDLGAAAVGIRWRSLVWRSGSFGAVAGCFCGGFGAGRGGGRR